MERAHKVFSSDGVPTVHTPQCYFAGIQLKGKLVDNRAQNYTVTWCAAPNSVVLRSYCQKRDSVCEGGEVL